MSIYAEKRGGKPTGLWLVEVMRDGKRTRARAKDIQAAKALEARLVAGESLVRDEKRGSSSVITLGWLVQQSGEIWRGRRDDQSARRFEVAAREMGLETPIADINRARLVALKERLVKLPARRRITEKTLNRYLAAVSAALRWAVENEKLAALPAVPWERQDEFVATYFTENEERLVIDWLVSQGQHDIALAIRVYATTGLRANELLSLTPDRVRDGWLVVGTVDDRTKNGTVGTVPIDPELEAPLRDLVARGVPGYRVLLKWLKKACVANGLPPKTLHKLRHTTATRLTSAGVPTATVQEFLRHKTIQTTLKYIHTESKALTDAAGVLWKRGPHVASMLHEGQSAGQSAGQIGKNDAHGAFDTDANLLISLDDGSGGGTRTPDTRIMIASPKPVRDDPEKP